MPLKQLFSIIQPNFDAVGNSSAIGEKMNDLVVSNRQKHNGMSWSKAGSVGLATITTLKRNKENDKWFETKGLNFKLAA